MEHRIILEVRSLDDYTSFQVLDHTPLAFHISLPTQSDTGARQKATNLTVTKYDELPYVTSLSVARAAAQK